MKLKELRKKSLAGFLAAAMVMTSANVVSAAPDDGTDASQDVSEENASAESTDTSENNSEVPEDAEAEAASDQDAETPEEELDGDYDALEEAVKKNSSITQDGKVRVSIVVDQASTLGRGYSTEGIGQNAQAMSYRQQALSTQQALQNRISKQALNGADLDVVWNITLAGNMISAWVPVDALSEIADVDGVAEVIVETRYEVPKTGSGDAVKPQMSISGSMTDSVNIWGNAADGYTGAGSQVAIIDTGFDSDHQSFAADSFMHSIDEIKAAGRNVTLMTQADVAAVWPNLNAASLNSGTRYNARQAYRDEKVPFGFNYVDKNLEITHDNDDQGDHGSHVSGIAAANRYVKDASGKYVSALDTVLTQGQAPDAQVVVMKVFGAAGGAYDSDYMVAVEDAVMLGCESINLSLGSSQPGFTKDVSDSSSTYNSIFNALTKSDAVVNIAAGNSGSWSDSAGTGGVIYSDDVNFDTVGKPGSYTNSLAVASADNDGMTGNYVTAYGKSIFYNESKYKNESLTTLAREQAYDYVYIDGTATKEEVSALGNVLKNKIVLCKRGAITFVEKAENIVAAGGLATLIANNTTGSISLDLTNYTQTRPVVSLTEEEGNHFRDNAEKKSKGGVTYYEGKLTVSDTIGNIRYNNEYVDMSDFSSWGVPSSLTIKPEITAPGGNIYSINGTDKSGTAYRNSSGTSMATPQVTGITAVLSQFVKDHGLDQFAKEHGLTVRALQQSLLMGTAVPIRDKATGNFYPVIRQGAGLVNLDHAANADTLIIMDESATDSAKDGKVKAEVGEDPDRIGEFAVKFTVYNTSDEEQALDLSGEFFTQQYAAEDGVTYMVGETAVIPAEITWLVDGKVLDAVNTSDVDAVCDFNGDGTYTRDDARAVLAYAVGKTDAIKANMDNADLDRDGDIDTYDAFLALNQVSNLGGAAVPANGSIQVEAQVKVTMPAELDDKGNYVEGYLFAKEQSSKEGETGVTQSIPVLGYYGSWTEPSMFDKGSAIDTNHKTETRTPYSAEAGTPSNSISYTIDTRNAPSGTLTFGENPFVTDETWHPERAAINKSSKISKISYSLIRNAEKVRFIVEDENGKEYFKSEPASSQYGAFYNESSSEQVKWENLPTDMSLTGNYDRSKNFTSSTLSGVPEGTMLRFALEAAPEYYAAADGTVNWEALGEGAKIEVKAVMDTKAPELVKAEGIKDSYGRLTGIRVTAKDDNYIAGAELLQSSYRSLAKLGAPEEQTKGGETELTFTSGVSANVSSYTLRIYDYAGNNISTTLSARQLGLEEKQDTEAPEDTEEVPAEETAEETPETEEAIEAETEDEIPAEDEAPAGDENADAADPEAGSADAEVVVPTGSLNEATVKDTEEKAETDRSNSAAKEYSESGDTVTVALFTENASTNGKYELAFNAKEVEVVKAEGANEDTAYNTESGKVVFGYINDIPYEAGHEVGQVVFKAKSGNGTVTVKTVEENKAAGSTETSYEYKKGKFKAGSEEEEKPHEHSFGEWKASKDYSGIYRECSGCDEKEEFKNNFKDLKGEKNPFFIPVLWAAHDGITTGVSADTFGLKHGCTRAQVVTFLWTAAGKPEPTIKNNPFKDVKENSYYYKATLWAAENGITSGVSKDTFGVNQSCTRAQIVTFLWKYAGSPEVKKDVNPFKDVKENSPYYKAILWAVENGITSGVSKDTFGVRQSCTRAQTVTFLYRYFFNNNGSITFFVGLTLPRFNLQRRTPALT